MNVFGKLEKQNIQIYLNLDMIISFSLHAHLSWLVASHTANYTLNFNETSWIYFFIDIYSSVIAKGKYNAPITLRIFHIMDNILNV